MFAHKLLEYKIMERLYLNLKPVYVDLFKIHKMDYIT